MSVRFRTAIASLVTASLLLGACTSSGSSGSGSSDAAVDLSGDLVSAEWDVTPGVEQITVTGAAPSQPLTLVDAQGERLLTLEATDDGEASFAYLPFEHVTLEAGPGAEEAVREATVVPPGDGYRIVDDSGRDLVATEPFAVLDRDDAPDESLYESQTLEEGYNYIETRDGVTLSANVTLPDPGTWGDGPYPTVVEYSGYSPSRPDGSEPGSQLADLLGFATVGVNMRGSGCSGGVFELFSPAQQADGYDAIEAIARQPWVLHGEVGMIGLSYSGISQLYVASTRPPSLAAITPLSVIEDLYRIQRPGGIYNVGFTRQWLEQRDQSNAAEGQSWVSDQIDDGDTECESNIEIRDLNPDFEGFGRALEYYLPLLDDRRLGLLVEQIEVPVYLTGAWQDEQTGGWFPAMLDDFTGTDTKKFTLFNGRHPDGYTPLVLTRWWEFLELYVARRVPNLSPGIRAAAPGLFEQIFEAPGLEFEADRFEEFGPDDYDRALETYESEPEVRILFESGAGSDVPGAPVERFEMTFDEWPPPTDPVTWYLGPDGTLVSDPPTDDDAGVDTYLHDPEAGTTTYTDEGANDFLYPEIGFDWTRFPDGRQLSYETVPFDEDVVVLGHGFADLWVASQEEDVNVQVTLTAVQPDGTEWLVQSGWLRLGHRAVIEDPSDDLFVDYTFARDDFEPLTPGEFIQARVPIFPVGQVFREGTRLRLTVETPGRNSPLWQFENPEYGGDVAHEVARTPAMPSFLRLPVLGVVDADIPADPPPCPSLRGQVCRDYVAVANGGAG